MKMTVKNSEGSEFGPPKDVVLNNKIVNVKIIEVEQKTSPFLVNKDDPSSGFAEQISFKFECEDEIEGWPSSKGAWFWGNTSTTFSNNPNCKLYNWVCAIFAVDSIEADFEVDLLELVGETCKVQITTNANGKHRVKDVFSA